MTAPSEPTDLREMYRTVIESQRRDTERTLEQGRSQTEALEVARAAAARLDWLLKRIDTKVACKRGCHWCCHLHTEVLPIEAIVLAQFVLEQPRTRRQAVAKRIRDFDDRLHGIDQNARAELNVPCPFLEDRICIAHQYRPLSCRSWHSLSAGACLDGWKSRSASTVRVDGRRVLVRYLIDVGVMRALTGAGLDARQLELVAAVRLILDSPDVVDRWLSGERALQAAYGPEAPDWTAREQRMIEAMIDLPRLDPESSGQGR